MLILSRKPGEKIVAPRCGLSVTVIGIEGNRVRLGITAPAEIAVHREELWDEIRADGASFVDTKKMADRVAAFADELSATAHQIAIRHGLAESWADLESELRRAVTRSSKKRGKELSRTATKPNEHDVKLARLPR